MAKPCSEDLRSRVANAIRSGESSRSIAERFGLAPSTVIKWAKRLRETGSVAPAKFGGHLRCRLEAHRDYVRGQVEEVPHLTLHRLKDLLRARGVIVSHDTVWRFLRREGLSFKKTLLAAEQHRADVVRRRQRWRHAMPHLDPARLVFIDETPAFAGAGYNQDQHGADPRLGAEGAAPQGLCSRRPLEDADVSGRSAERRAGCAVRHRRPINGALFRGYIEQFLVPTLSRGDIVIIDNLGSHRARAVRDAIVGVGARLAFLPPYSPDLNPIEQVFAKVKHWMRLAQARCIAAVHDRIANLVRSIPANECANYLRNAGYASI